MRKLLFVIFVVAALVSSLSIAHASVISEDVAYWYKLNGNSPVQTVFNPDTATLNSLLPYLLVKVQQTVYDPAQTLQILTRDHKSSPAGGYLYAYSVTNLNWEDGISAFRVDWGNATPLLVATSSRVTPSYWSVGNDSVPAWYSNPSTDYGIAPGETVGGFWAVATTGVDKIVDAQAAKVAINEGVPLEWISGTTTGPSVPDPSPLMSLASGLFSLVIFRATKKR